MCTRTFIAVGLINCLLKLYKHNQPIFTTVIVLIKTIYECHFFTIETQYTFRVVIIVRHTLQIQTVRTTLYKVGTNGYQMYTMRVNKPFLVYLYLFSYISWIKNRDKYDLMILHCISIGYTKSVKNKPFTNSRK